MFIAGDAVSLLLFQHRSRLHVFDPDHRAFLNRVDCQCTTNSAHIAQVILQIAFVYIREQCNKVAVRSNNQFAFFPACAGSSVEGNGSTSQTPDHPRVCGEQPRSTSKPTWQGGSPPRVRGAVHQRRTEAGKRRITPACAGSRLPRLRSSKLA